MRVSRDRVAIAEGEETTGAAQRIVRYPPFTIRVLHRPRLLSGQLLPFEVAAEFSGKPPLAFLLLAVDGPSPCTTQPNTCDQLFAKRIKGVRMRTDNDDADPWASTVRIAVREDRGGDG